MPKLSRSPSLPPPILDAQSSLAALESAATTLSTPITSSSPQLPPTSIPFNPTPLDNQQRQQSSTGPNAWEEISEEFQQFFASPSTLAKKTTGDTGAQKTPNSALNKLKAYLEPYPDSFLESYIVIARKDDENDSEGAKGWDRLRWKIVSDEELGRACTIGEQFASLMADLARAVLSRACVASLIKTLSVYLKPTFVELVIRYYHGLVTRKGRNTILNAYFSIFCIDLRIVVLNVLRMEFEYNERKITRMQENLEPRECKKDGEERGRRKEETGGGEGDDGLGREKGDLRGAEKVHILWDTSHLERLQERSPHFSLDTVKVTYEHMFSRKEASETPDSGLTSAELQQDLRKRSTSFEKAVGDIIPGAPEALEDTFSIGKSKAKQDDGLVFVFHSTTFNNYLSIAQFYLADPLKKLNYLSTGPHFLLSNSLALAFSQTVLINPRVRDDFLEPIVVLAFKVPRNFFEEGKGTSSGKETLMKEVCELSSWNVENFSEECKKGELKSFVETNMALEYLTYLHRPVEGGPEEPVDVVIAPWFDPKQSKVGGQLIARGMWGATTPGSTSLQVACTSPESMAELLRYHYQNYEEDLVGLTVGRC